MLYHMTNIAGPVGEKSDPCQTCFNNILGCPGHIGHIELPLPVVNPLFYNIIRSLLKITCVTCFRLQISGKYKISL